MARGRALNAGLVAFAIGAVTIVELLYLRHVPSPTVPIRAIVYVVLGIVAALVVGVQLVARAQSLGVTVRWPSLGRHEPFASRDELFHAVDELLVRLEDAGQQGAATQLRVGMASLNGLTDGWAALLDAIDAVRASDAARFSPADHRRLERIRAAVYAQVAR